VGEGCIGLVMLRVAVRWRGDLCMLLGRPDEASESKVPWRSYCSWTGIDLMDHRLEVPLLLSW
jgi:hypothetical protein